MNEGGKSDDSVVPAKPPNKAASAAAEAVEGRESAKGNTAGKRVPDTGPDQTRRAQCAGSCMAGGTAGQEGAVHRAAASR